MTSGVTATSSSVTRPYVGTSGWSYPSWKPGFYPADAKPAEFLHHYAERLPTVELNTTGYRLVPIRVLVGSARDEGFIQLALGSIDPQLRVAFDFRHDSWDGADLPLPDNAVRVNDLDADAPFRYVRLREPPYSDAELQEWAARLRPLVDDDVDIYCYFRHEDEPTAPQYAERLRELVSPA